MLSPDGTYQELESLWASLVSEEFMFKSTFSNIIIKEGVWVLFQLDLTLTVSFSLRNLFF